MKDAGSFLYNKKLVFNTYTPVPFCIYEGMLESTYLVSNQMAFSSVVSPGLYEMLRNFIEAIPVKRKLVIDDILGMCAIIPEKGGKTMRVLHGVWTTEFIKSLTSLNRIVWRCPHREMDDAVLEKEIPAAEAVICAPPVHTLHRNRLNVVNAQVVNDNPEKWFVIPAGDNQHREMAPLFYSTHVRRDVYAMHIPCVAVDNGWVVIPPRNVTPPSVLGVTIAAMPSIPGRGAVNTWEIGHERNLFQSIGA